MWDAAEKYAEHVTDRWGAAGGLAVLLIALAALAIWWLARENARKEIFARKDRETALADARRRTEATMALSDGLQALSTGQARIEGLLLGRGRR